MKKLVLVAALLGAAFAATPQSQTALPTLRVTAAHFEYVGAFRLPGPAGGPGGPTGDGYSFNGGGEALALSPDGQGLYLAGSRCCADPTNAGPSTVAEIAIPEVRRVATIAGLATASYRQVHADVLSSRQRDVGCGGPIGGILPINGHTLFSVYCYYDAGYVQIRSHFRRTSLSLTGGTLTGPLEVQSPATGGGRAGFVAGYMGTIPAEWRAAFGGDALTGLCCVPIITRTSWGPAVSVVRSQDFDTTGVVPAVSVLGYPSGTPLDGDAACAATSVLFNCNTAVGGVVFVPGTASVLFFGTQGTGEACYGFGTSDKALVDTVVPPPAGDGREDRYCYDPAAGSKGGHAYPYRHQVWAYDAHDLLRVKNGQMQRHQVRPYAVFELETPFQHIRRAVNGAAYDAATGRLYLSMGEQDAPRPLIQVFRLNLGVTPPPVVTPPPAPTPTDATVSAWSAWMGGSWSACANGTQSRTETRTRTVVTPATNGGATPPLSETRTASQSCTVPTPPADPPPAANVIQAPGTIRSIARNTREVCTTSWFRKTCTQQPLNEWTITVQAGTNTVRILVTTEPVGLKSGDGWDTVITVR